MDDAAIQLELARKAICSGLSNCVEWVDARTETRVRNDSELLGLRPRAIKRLLIEWVAADSERLIQKPEERPNWKTERDYWYHALVDVEGLPRPLFVELVLSDDGDDCPAASIVNAHLSAR